jgi:transposase-like protein
MVYKKQRTGKRSPYSDSFRRMVVEEVLSGSIYIAGAAKKYGIAHRSTVSSWIKWYHNNSDIELSKLSPVAEQEADKSIVESEQLEKLKAELEFARLKIIGLETLIDVAEEQLNIDIRKKPGTKQ